MHSSLQALNKKHWTKEQYQEKSSKARVHVNICMEVCQWQCEQKRCFLLEHPAEAKSWKLPEGDIMAGKEGVYIAEFDMCRFGMQARDEQGVLRRVRKSAKLITNSWEVARRLQLRCPTGKSGESSGKATGCDYGGRHQHTALIGGRAKLGQIYPRALCQAVCAGIAAQTKAERLRAVGMPILSLEEMSSLALAAVEHEVTMGMVESGKRDFELQAKENPSQVLHEDVEDWWAKDDVSGEALDPAKVKEARREELAYFRSMGVCEKVPIEMAIKETGRKPIAVRWIDINKGDNDNLVYRSRLVAKEFSKGAQQDPELCAATPPSECLRMCLSSLATRDKDYKLLYLHVSRAFFYAKAVRPVFVKLPDEDIEEGDEHRCGRLFVPMHGTSDAAAIWHHEYVEALEQFGMTRGAASPCLLSHKKLDLSVFVHGDHFVAVDPGRSVKQLEEYLKGRYKVKAQIMGSGDTEEKELNTLNRIVRHNPREATIEAGPRHCEVTIKDMGFAGQKVSRVPGSKEEAKKAIGKEGKDDDDDGEVQPKYLAAKEARRFRALTTRLNHIAADRPDLQHAVNECARHMSRPRMGSWVFWKRLRGICCTDLGSSFAINFSLPLLEFPYFQTPPAAPIPHVSSVPPAFPHATQMQQGSIPMPMTASSFHQNTPLSLLTFITSLVRLFITHDPTSSKTTV